MINSMNFNLNSLIHNSASQLKNYSLEYLHLNVNHFQNWENKSIHSHVRTITIYPTLMIQNAPNIGMDK